VLSFCNFENLNIAPVHNLAVLNWQPSPSALCFPSIPRFTMGSEHPSKVFKILTKEQWAAWKANGVFTGAGVDIKDGYIHLSTSEQVRLSPQSARHPSACFSPCKILVLCSRIFAGTGHVRQVLQGSTRVGPDRRGSCKS
jgi:hypothetical protein